MSCACDWDGGPDLYHEDEVRARKEHTCCECGGTILPGQIYQRASGLWEGEFSHYKTCERCADLRESLAEVACPAFGGLRDAYHDYLREMGVVRTEVLRRL